MPINQLIVGGAVLLWSVVVGLSVIAFGQLLLAIREIALNTRKDEPKPHHGHYVILLTVARINNVLGWIVLVLGVAAGIYFAVSGVPILIQGQTGITA
jgi:hypothetical protein